MSSYLENSVVSESLFPLFPAPRESEPRRPSTDGAMRSVVQMFYHLVDLVSVPLDWHSSGGGVGQEVVDHAYRHIEELFADAVYLRCDKAPLRGRDIGNFYRHERRLVGKHVLANIHLNETTAVVTGLFMPIVETRVDFSGTGMFVEEVTEKLRFCDIWQFRPDGTVMSRETYLACGAELIEGLAGRSSRC